ncbi:MAG TPA: carboxypeptidase-like regulatory domain-containing protein [Thermoanaerobaculia bacterium]
MRFNAWQIAILLLIAAPAAQAQLWSGRAAVEVRAQDQKGLPVAGAQVKLQYNALDPKDGPPPVVTDSRGNATVGGLAEGSWLLEVSHQGFMTYMAEVNVREGGRPTVILATQVNVPGALRTMRVELSRGRAARASAPARPAEAAPRPEPVAPAPRPEVRPAPAPRPAPEPPAEAAPSTAPSTPPAPEPAPQVQPAPEPPREQPAAPKMPEPPAAAPAPAVEPAPRPTPVTPAPAPSPDPVRLRSSRDRTCADCPPGESALSTERVVPPGGGSGCGGDIAAQLKGGEVPAGLPSGCHVLKLTLPAGARYTGYRYEVQASGDSLDCLAGRDCAQGAGRWPINPVLVRGPQETVVLAPFESGPAERERRAVLTVYFTTEMVKRRR